ncbi:hypothetical protein HPP92_004256 [Vanilla planifolia]|uniref:Uncharacterized protein n=1 Tax=Vanilla planifolia TaxID=51239 RepID=A0A835RVZ7_VANPL|nr:hypothetical protein HPP92_004256 [Vanilla planifolia]
MLLTLPFPKLNSHGLFVCGLSMLDLIASPHPSFFSAEEVVQESCFSKGSPVLAPWFVELVVPVQEFRTDCSKTTPYMSAPSSPDRFGTDSFEDDEFFVFDFSGHFEKGNPPPEPSTADELFEQGRIRPLNPPPHPHIPVVNKALAEDTGGRGRRRASSAFSLPHPEAERDRLPFLRSPGDNDGDGSRRWWIKDCFLFRSASEGRATGDRSKDPLRKFTAFPSASTSLLLTPKQRDCFRGDDSRSSSFRSVDSSGSLPRGKLSPHAAHYTANRTAAEGMKKKTALPYRQGFFGRLQFSPALDRLTCRSSHH